MSRRRRFISALGSGYLALVANVFFTAISVPLALHYLTREEFGLWSVVLQITGYLSLLDLGVGQSVSRLLIDWKDDVNGGVYGAVLKTASVAFAFQALAVVVFGVTCNHAVSQLMNIPAALRSTFEALLLWQCVTVAITFLATPLTLPLWSHQRSDLVNIAAVATFAVSLGFLWIGFALGFKTFGLLVSSIAGTLTSISLNACSTLRLKVLPSRANWGVLSWERFWEVFRFSRDLFLLGLAAQLISASQLVLVSRLISLDAAAVWSVCMKSFAMAQLVVCRVLDFSAAGLAELVVWGEHERFRSRLASIVALSAIGAGFFGVLGAFGNQGFVSFWTNGRIGWNSWNDVCAATYLFLICVSRCYTMIAALLKQIGNYKYVSLLEGVLVITGSILLAPHLNFLGILASSVIANILCSGLYGIMRVSKYFHASVVDITFGWLAGPFRFICAFVLVGSVIFWAGGKFQGPLAFGFTAACAGLCGFVLAMLIGLPNEFRTELLTLVRKSGWRTFFQRNQSDNP